MGFLWRVRRKLTLSYVFIGFVPVLLLASFFLLCGLLLFFNVSSYLVQSRVNALIDETRFLAEASAIELGFPYDFIRGGRSSFLGAVTELIDDHRGTVV